MARTENKADVYLKSYLQNWLRSRRNEVRPRTFDDYTRNIDLLTKELGHIKLSALTPDDIERASARILDAGTSPQTMLHCHRRLTTALNTAVSQDLIPSNPMYRVDKMETPPQSVRILTASERERVLRSAASTEVESVVFTAMHTGLKRGELLALKRDAINLEQGTLTVTHTLSNSKGSVARLPALLGSQRTISLDDKVIQHLEPHLDINDDAFLFRRSTGEQILPNYATHVFKKLVRKIGLYDVQFQDLRHAYVAMQIEAGKPFHSIMEYIGLRDTRSMTDVYGHLFKERE